MDEATSAARSQQAEQLRQCLQTLRFAARITSLVAVGQAKSVASKLTNATQNQLLSQKHQHVHIDKQAEPEAPARAH